MSKKSKRMERRTVGGLPRGEPGEFNPDYGYVRSDLRRIAILAGTFVVLLVILSLLVE